MATPNQLLLLFRKVTPTVDSKVGDHTEFPHNDTNSQWSFFESEKDLPSKLPSMGGFSTPNSSPCKTNLPSVPKFAEDEDIYVAIDEMIKELFQLSASPSSFAAVHPLHISLLCVLVYLQSNLILHVHTRTQFILSSHQSSHHSLQSAHRHPSNPCPLHSPNQM